MIIKQCQFSGKDDNGVYVHLVRPGEYNDHLTKEAQAGPPQLEKAREIIYNAPKKDGHIYTFVSAMGAGEYWGSNSNGDDFPEEPLIHTPPGWNEMSHSRQRTVGKAWEWGYPTFYNAHAFQHHVNKDPARAFGSVYYTMWDNHMKRVLLILELSGAAATRMGAQGVLDRIENGEFPDVSMGCFSAGMLVSMADGTRKPIEDVTVGEKVITHKGRVRKVTEVHKRKYKGDLYSIKAEAHRVLRCTHRHPLLSVLEYDVKKKDSHSNLIWRTNPQLSPEWRHAECLDSEYLIEPVLNGNSDKSIDVARFPTLRSLARVTGYYLADGHVFRNDTGKLAGVEFTVNKSNQIVEEIDILCEELCTKNKPVIRPKANSEEALKVSIHDEFLAKRMFELAGSYSLDKRLSLEVMSWPPTLLLEVLGAYTNGDGCSYEGSIRLSTASIDLAHQFMVILPRLGVLASMSSVTHKAGSGFNRVDTLEHAIWIGKQWASILAPYSSKIKTAEVLKKKNSRMIYGDNIVTPIRDIEAMYVETDVYNLEVEEDESYLVEGLAVHNCKVPFDICADWERITPLLGKPKLLLAEHKKKPIRGISVTRNDYCQHLRFEINKIYPDGKKVRMMNYHPKFFDISHVFIGADKTSKVMAKLAGEQLCPIRNNAPMCKKGCYTCAIPSSHVYEVWSRDNMPKEKEASATSAIAKHVGKRTGIGAGVGGVKGSLHVPSAVASGVLTRKKMEPEVEKTAERAERSGAVAVSIKKPKKKPDVIFWDGITADGKRTGGSVVEGTPEWDEYHKKMNRSPSTGFSGKIVGGKLKEASEDEAIQEIFGIDKQSAIDLAKKAEIIKQIRSNFSNALPQMESEEKEIPKELLNSLAKDLPDALASAGSMGIIAKPKEFQRMILIARGQPELADGLDEHGLCFNPGAKPSSDSMVGKVIPKILEMLSPLLGDRSALAPAMHRRIIKITIVKPTNRPKDLPEELSDSPILNKISADYSAYRQQLLYKSAALINQLIHEHPVIIADLLGDLHINSLSGGLVKAGGDVMESVIGMFPIDYMNKAYLGKPVSEYVDTNCDLSSLVTIGDLASCGKVA